MLNFQGYKLLPLNIPKIFNTNDYGASAVATIWTWSYCESQLLGLQCNSGSAMFFTLGNSFDMSGLSGLPKVLLE